jgi:hypothetical protein
MHLGPEQSCESQSLLCIIMCVCVRAVKECVERRGDTKLVAALNFSCCRFERAALDYYVGTAVWPVIIALFNMHELFLPPR